MLIDHQIRKRDALNVQRLPAHHHLLVKQWAKPSFREAMVVDKQLADANRDCTPGVVSLSYCPIILRTHRTFHSSSESAMTEIGCGAFFKTLLSRGCFPSHDLFRLPSNVYHGIAKPFEGQTSAYSNVAEVRRPHLSISSKDSDSVGSISIHVEMGHETVGG
jgi:hypothetical protein